MFLLRGCFFLCLLFGDRGVLSFYRPGRWHDSRPGDSDVAEQDTQIRIGFYCFHEVARHDLLAVLPQGTLVSAPNQSASHGFQGGNQGGDRILRKSIAFHAPAHDLLAPWPGQDESCCLRCRCRFRGLLLVHDDDDDDDDDDRGGR